RPHPDRRNKQAEHHRLDDDVGGPEQAEDRKVRGSERRQLGYFGGVHGAKSSRLTLVIATGGAIRGTMANRAASRAMPRPSLLDRRSRKPSANRCGPGFCAKFVQTRAPDPSVSPSRPYRG